ncbi:hypothetical protein DRN67_01235, partial [Candidatus Micrarchaeota archaeon]
MRSTNLIILTVALVMLVGIIAGECKEGSASMLVPAVVGDEGHMLEISVEVKEGDGSIFMSTEPYVGVQTQNSERIAVSVASRLLAIDLSECDVLFRIGEGNGLAEAVDGPSAGAAMTIMLLSVLNETPMIPEFSMTGTIEADGSVGSVGGVSAKAEAAAQSGVAVFITPRLDIYERMLLSGVKKRHEIGVYEVRDIFQAASIALGGNIPEEPENKYIGTEIPENLGLYALPASEELERFVQIAEETLEDAEGEVEAAEQRGDGEFDEYFEGEIAAAHRLLDAGYYYSGANLAFLTMVDASIVGREATQEEVAATRREVLGCLVGLQKPELRMDNLDEVFGGEVRKMWVRIKLEEVEQNEAEGVEANIYKLREMEYARQWCKLVERLYEYEGQGNVLEENLLEVLAMEKLEEAQAMASAANEDLKWHVAAAERAYDNGNYGAAIYDSAYAIGMYSADVEMVEMSPSSIRKEVELFLESDVEGLWPNLYKMQVAYYYSAGEADLATAYRMARFVEELDEARAESIL